MAQPIPADDEDQAARSGDIVVTASGFEQRVEQAPASITVLSREELEETRYQSLAEALANVEGVDVGASAGKTGGLNISIRGMPSDYTLVLIDGRRQNAAGNVTPNGFGETSTSFIPPMSAIERIEVVRGPVSTLYGSDAMGGVINIITRKVGSEWVLNAAADATLQSESQFGNIYSGNGFVQGPLIPNLLGLSLRGRYSVREESSLSYELDDGGAAIISQRGPSPVQNRLWSVGGRLSFTPHRDHDILLDVDLSGQWYDNSTAQLGTLGVSGYTNEQRFDQQEYVLSHNWRLPFGELHSSLSRATRETIGRVIPSGVPGKVAGSARTLESTNTIFDTKLSSRIANHTFTIGGQYWDAEMVDGVAPAPYTHEQWAVFVEDEWRLFENFALTGGIRYDNHSIFGDHFSPRAYAVWNVTEMFTLKGGISQGFKTPRLDQITPGITGFTGQGTIPTIGTPTLQPETSTSIEASIFFDTRNGFRANVTYFNNKFEDKIATGVPVNNCSFGLTQAEYDSGVTATPDCADYGYFPRSETFSQTVNIDDARTQGVEAAFRWEILPSLALSGNYTYTKSRTRSVSTGATARLYDTPKHMLNGSLRWEATDRLNLWVRGEYRSSRYRSEDSATSTAKATYGNYRSYEVFHIGGSYEFNDNIRLGATVYNVLNKDFVSYGSYVSNTNTGAISYTNLYSNNQEPRRLWLSLNVDF